MKEGWEYKKLGEVCGKCSNIKWDDVSNEASYRYIDLTSVDRGDLHIHNPQNIRKDNAPSRAKQIIKAGDVIFATTRPTLRRVSIIEEQYDGDICSTGFCVLRHNEVVKSRFVFYALLYDGFYKYIEPLQTGANYPAVTDNVVKNYIIPVPPLPEQQRIVDYLDSAFAKIDAMKANAEKALNEAKALFQASLKEMLEPKEGWEEKKLDDIGELKNGMNFNKNESGYNIHILGVGDFGNLFQIEDTDYLQRIALNSNPSEEYILKNEDIVFVRSNGNKNLVGRCVLIHVGDEPCFFSGFCIRFRKSTNEVDACYLTYFLKTEESRRKLVGNGANISNLNQKVLNEFVVSYPSIQEQQSIVETLDSLKSKVDRLQENYNKISQECDALKQAILRQVFE